MIRPVEKEVSNINQGKLRNMVSIYITNKDKMLLLYRVGSKVVQPSWCGIGGHFEKDELNDAKAALLRELKEEIGLEESGLRNLELRYITLRVKGGEVRQNYYFFADLSPDAVVQEECDEGILEWVELGDVMQRSMPFTAEYVIKHYLTEGRLNHDLYSGVVVENGVIFTKLEEF